MNEDRIRKEVEEKFHGEEGAVPRFGEASGEAERKFDSKTDKVLRRWANYGDSFYRVAGVILAAFLVGLTIGKIL